MAAGGVALLRVGIFFAQGEPGTALSQILFLACCICESFSTRCGHSTQLGHE